MKPQGGIHMRCGLIGCFGLLAEKLAGNWDTFNMLVFFRVGKNWFSFGVDAGRDRVSLDSPSNTHHHQVPFTGVQITIVGPLGNHDPLVGFQGSLIPVFEIGRAHV